MTNQGALTGDSASISTGWHTPDRGSVGILMFIFAEAVLFGMFIAAYVAYIGQSTSGPTPAILSVPIISTVCLLSSSLTIMVAESALKKGHVGNFKLWWFVTIVLGLEFLFATAVEWRHLIVDEHFTISTNLFGTTFYSLVGLHGSHVIVGLVFLILVMLVSLFGFDIKREERRVKLLSWYWHFVDVVWVFVFTVVYIIGR